MPLLDLILISWESLLDIIHIDVFNNRSLEGIF